MARGRRMNAALAAAAAGAVAAAVAAAAATAAATTVVPLPRLPIECHSFNDLDMWPQLLRKGVRWLKTDYSYCTAAACEAYSTFNTGPGTGSLDDCYASSDGNTYCCICMRGDASTRPALTAPFNTSWDLLAFLGDAARAAYLPAAATDAATPLMIGLDWGGPGVDIFNATEAALARGFLLALNATIAAAQLAVRPYFDAGTSGWFNALDVLCAAGNCTAAQAALQALPWPSEAGDALPPASADPYNRFAILNSDESDLWDDCQAASWNASLAKADAYPYLWYEPSSQIEYLAFFDFWGACPSVPPDKRPPNTGVVVVSNQAPEMFETYASSAIGRGFNALLLPDAHTAPLVVVVDFNATAYDRAAVVATTVAGAAAAAVTVVGLVDGVAPTTADIVASGALPLPAGAAAVALAAWHAATPAATVPLLAAAACGSVAWLTWTPATGVLAPSANGTLPPPPGGTLVAAAPVCTATGGCVVVAAWAAGTALTLVVTSPDGAATLAAATVQDTYAVVAGASLALSPVAGGSGDAVTAAGLLLYGASAPDANGSTARHALFGAYVQVAVAAGAATLTVERSGGGGAPTRVALGSAPHVVTAWYNGSLVALASNTDGLCQCGLIMNNGNAPHCLLATPAVDADPLYALYQSVPYLLNYNFGTVDAFRRAFNGTAAGLDAYLGACHSEIASGKFENGAAVAGALYPRLVTYINSTEAPNGGPTPEIAALFVHDGNVVCPVVTTLVCGSPLPKAGIVFDQFRLLQSAAAPLPT